MYRAGYPITNRRIMNAGQFTQRSMLEEVRGMDKPGNKVLGYVPSERIVGAKENVKLANELGARHGEQWVEGRNLEYNQFGDLPRTVKQVQDNLDLRDAPWHRKDLD